MESKIKQIAEEMGLGYLYCSWYEANDQLDDMESFPVLVNILPTSGRLNLSMDEFRDNPNCIFAFFDQLGVNEEQASATAERMKKLMKRFIVKMNESRAFDYIDGDIEYSIAYDKMDARLVGVILSVSVKELNGQSTCDYD